MTAEATADGGSGTARRMWRALETLHMTVYFAPEPRDAYRRAGLRGGWMGYFASRSAAMGPVPAEVVMATFYNFHPAWSAGPSPTPGGSRPRAGARGPVEGADAALRRLLGDWAGGPEAAEAAALARQAMEGQDPSGRPLFAAHAALPWPEEPHLALWHAATLYREFRGDGHVACLTVEGIGGCEAHVLAAGAGQLPGSVLREYRGWSDEEWAAAVERLKARGWVEDDGSLTDAGRAARDARERRTDELAMPPGASSAPSAAPACSTSSTLRSAWSSSAAASRSPTRSASPPPRPDGERGMRRPAALLTGVGRSSPPGVP